MLGAITPTEVYPTNQPASRPIHAQRVIQSITSDVRGGFIMARYQQYELVARMTFLIGFE